jgi:alanine-glyoxylate transaminase/serine-glyoxylate transaminase/serine-pyruvate transaminase
VPAARSVSVTAIEVSSGIDPEALRSVARERFQVAIAGGLGPLHGRVFRIGHLGDMNEAMILGCLAGVEAAMQAQGIALRAPRRRRGGKRARRRRRLIVTSCHETGCEIVSRGGAARAA